MLTPGVCASTETSDALTAAAKPDDTVGAFAATTTVAEGAGTRAEILTAGAFAAIANAAAGTCTLAPVLTTGASAASCTAAAGISRTFASTAGAAAAIVIVAAGTAAEAPADTLGATAVTVIVAEGAARSTPETANCAASGADPSGPKPSIMPLVGEGCVSTYGALAATVMAVAGTSSVTPWTPDEPSGCDARGFRSMGTRPYVERLGQKLTLRRGEVAGVACHAPLCYPEVVDVAVEIPSATYEQQIPYIVERAISK